MFVRASRKKSASNSVRSVAWLAPCLAVWLAGAAHAIPPLASPGAPPPAVAPPAVAPTTSDAVFLNFAAWVQTYRTTPENRKAALEAEGVALAQQRRQMMLALFDSDPERAMKWAMPWSTRALLPPAVAQLLEVPVAGCGAFNVLAARMVDPQSGALRVQIMRHAVVNGKIYKARVYGRKRGLTTKYNISQHGIAFDNVLLLHESPVRVLEPREAVPAGAKWGNADRKCPLCGKPAGGAASGAAGGEMAVIAQIGNTYYAFDSAEHVQRVAAQLEKMEAVVGPEEGSVCDEPLDKVIAAIKREDGKRGANEDEEPPLDRRDKPFGDD